MSSIIEYKKWDSEFFGFDVGELQFSGNETELQNIIHINGLQNYSLLYIFSDIEISTEKYLSGNIKFFNAPGKYVYSKDLVKTGFTLSTAEINMIEGDMNPKLINIALQIGNYSRFKLDPDFKPGIFEKLYTTWIKNAVLKTFNDSVFTINYDKNIAGMATFSKKKNNGSIGLFGIDEKYRGKGLGKNLINFISDYAYDQNCSRLFITTQSTNQDACKFYESCGFNIFNKKHVYHIWLNGGN